MKNLQPHDDDGVGGGRPAAGPYGSLHGISRYGISKDPIACEKSKQNYYYVVLTSCTKLGS